MEIINWILILTALLNAISSIVAWISRIKWSKEYSQAKDERLKAKDDTIQYLERRIVDLQELTPQKIQDHYKNVESELKKVIDELQNEIGNHKKEIEKKQELIDNLEKEKASQSEEILVFQTDLDKSLEKYHQLKGNLENYQHYQDILGGTISALNSAEIIRKNLKPFVNSSFDEIGAGKGEIINTYPNNMIFYHEDKDNNVPDDETGKQETT
jgi:DNA repair exonuclease SbcCD ATPase subunit